jgi:outer membrane scaffolding protein for murein synthesis (MipA/OmpV family)
MKQTRRTLTAAALIGAALAILPATPAAAQDERDWIVTIGGGPQVFPKYPGADALGVFPMPIIDLYREGDPLPFEAPDEGIGFGILGDDSVFDFGPALVLQNKRREEDVGAPVGEVGMTVEVGAFAELFIGENFRLRAEGRRGIGGHDGWVGDVAADLVLRDRDTYVFSIGPRARISDGNYHDAYFSVTPAVAAATGLPAFNAGGGIHAVGVIAGLKYKFDRNWGLYTYAGYDRLIGDAADSPIVRNFGSRDQLSGGIGIFYSFNAGNLFGG